MNMFDVLQAVGAIQGCTVKEAIGEGGAEALNDAMQDGYVNCIDGKLTFTKEGAAVYRGMRDSRSGG